MRSCKIRGNSFKWVDRGCRRYATSKRPSSSPPPPPKQQRAAPKPLPFQPAKPRPKPTPESIPKTAPKPTPFPSSPSSSSKGPQDKKRPVSELLRDYWFPLFGAGAGVVCVSFFASSLVYYWWTQPAEHWTPGQEPEAPTGRPTIQSPREFDQHLDKSEWRFGITKLRRQIGSELAHGHVLEVAVGAGRNFDYYDWSIVTAGLEPTEEKENSSWFGWSGKGEGKEKPKDVKTKGAQPQNENALLSFTGLDISPPMLDLALVRIRQVVPFMADQIPKKPEFSRLASKTADNNEEGISLANNHLRLLKADAQTSLPPPPPSPSSSSSSPKKYDTVIQTFGLCSVRDPVLLLSNMAAVVKPETGRIILLEHGRSWYELVNGLLDRSARKHFERFGCWWNRDVELVVRAAERSVPGLEVVRFERPGWTTLGTHILVEMHVRATPASAPAAAATLSSDEEAQDSTTMTGTGWWSSLLSVNSKPKKDD
ncbi:Methyltransferase OMS1, mitochondrial [Daldinia childiae]|uniref:Methyltransferase OMS1, mitochondrial n=1 Tax=Daldinia childiae TaxID=326645 RepID=UPI00144818FC|nr:Methyltransferase OMS1, mitochondrial [Daldinia childiae]KAF3055205.1 Methyltransferase OMS1, mitochondrial [Daldinia childiae]